jgi:hypothetical protein
VEKPIVPARVFLRLPLSRLNISLLVPVHTDDAHSRHISTTSLHDNALGATSGLTRVLAPLHLSDHQLKRLQHVLVVARARFRPGTLELFGKGSAVLGGNLALFGAEVGFVAYNDEGNPLDGLDGAGGQLSAYASRDRCTRDIECTYEVIEDLVPNDARHLEALLRSNRVDNHVAVDANEMLGVEDTVLVLWRDISSANSSRRPKGRMDVPACIEWVQHVMVGYGDARRDAGRKKSSKYLARRIDNFRCKVLVLIPDHLTEGVLNCRIIAVDKVAIDKLHCQTRLACCVRQSDTSHMLPATTRKLMAHSPTARLPTMATFLCLGAGILLLTFGGGRVDAERLASVQRSRSACTAGT